MRGVCRAGFGVGFGHGQNGQKICRAMVTEHMWHTRDMHNE